MSGVSTATAISAAGLALSAAGTASSFLGGLGAQGAAAQQAAQQQAYGVYQAQVQAQTQSAYYGHQEDVANQNMELARRQGALALRAGELDEAAAQDAERQGIAAVDKARTEGAQAYGTQRAILAAQGTDLAGSPIDVLADTEAATDTAARTAQSNAARTAYGYRLKGYEDGVLGKYNADISLVNAENQYSEAQAAQTNSKPGLVSNTYSSSGVAPYASLLGGASTLADKWQRLQYPITPTATPKTSGDLLSAANSGMTY